MPVLLDELAQRHRDEQIVFGCRWRRMASLPLPVGTSPDTPAFLATPRPPHAAELKPVELLGDELREAYLRNRVLDSLDAREDHLVASLLASEMAVERVRSIAAGPRIIDVWRWNQTTATPDHRNAALPTCARCRVNRGASHQLRMAQYG